MSRQLPASILARLLTLAKTRGDDYSLLLNRFALERLLCRISHSPHADRFLLKGALLFALWYHINASSLADTVALLDLLLWPPTEVAATQSDATATWMPEAQKWV